MADANETSGRVTRRSALRVAGGAMTIGGAGLAGALIAAQATDAATTGGAGQEIVGTWLNPRARNGGVTVATFSADGGWSNVHPNRNRTPAHGTWAWTGDRTYVITRWSLRFDDEDEFIGTTKTRAETVLDADGEGLSSTRISEYFDLNGNRIGVSPLVESRATRVRAESPR
jgi:hypothetical protein